MAMQDPRDLIIKMIDAFNTGDVSDANLFVSAQYVDHQGLGNGELRGVDGFRQVVGTARSSMRELEVSISEILVDEGKAAVRLRWDGIRKDDGTPEVRETIDIVRFENGQAVEHWGSRM